MSENIHKCIRCGYTTSHLVTFKRHLARKNLCKPKLSDASLINEYKKYNIFEKIHSNLLTPYNSINYTNPSKNFTCEFCSGNFSRKDNLTKHLKLCKIKN